MADSNSTRACFSCGAFFGAIRESHIYCSKKCKIKQWGIDNPEQLKQYSEKWNKKVAESKPQKSKVYSGICRQCDKPYCKKFPNHKCCSVECKENWIKSKYTIKPVTQACVACGTAFDTKRKDKSYCSKACGTKQWRLDNPEALRKLRDNWNKKIAESKPQYSKVYSGICKQCLASYCKQFSNEKCCSVKCKVDFDKARRSTIKDSRRTTREGVLKIVCKTCCKDAVVQYRTGKPPGYCSLECQKAAKKKFKRLHKKLNRRNHIDRARHYGCSYESVNVFKVLERDRYKCQLCGIKTPINKRGTCSDDAPELDHILPLSKGGSHSYLNVQCVCRKCNLLKGNRPMGQMRMF